MLSKIKTILLSRVNNNKEEEWIRRRRGICFECNYNTLNGGILKGYRFFLAILSTAFSYIMGRSKVDILGECSACGCSIYYKSESSETCVKGKWETLEDGSMNLNVLQQRNESNKNNKK